MFEDWILNALVVRSVWKVSSVCVRTRIVKDKHRRRTLLYFIEFLIELSVPACLSLKSFSFDDSSVLRVGRCVTYTSRSSAGPNARNLFQLKIRKLLPIVFPTMSSRDLHTDLIIRLAGALYCIRCSFTRMFCSRNVFRATAGTPRRQTTVISMWNSISRVYTLVGLIINIRLAIARALGLQLLYRRWNARVTTSHRTCFDYVDDERVKKNINT